MEFRMYPKIEQRGCSRFENEIPIVFNKLNEEKVNEARIYNSSSSGIYLESDIPIRPGTEIYIKKSDSTRLAGSNFCHLEVVRCEEIQDAVVLYRFGMGARFCFAVDNSKFVRPKLRVIRGGKGLG